VRLFNCFIALIFLVGLSSHNLDASKKRKKIDSKEVDAKKEQKITLSRLRNLSSSSSSNSSSSLSSRGDRKTLCDVFDVPHLVQQSLIPFLPEADCKNYFDFRRICKSACNAVEDQEMLDELKKADMLDINKKNAQGNTKLHRAALYGNMRVVKWLVHLLVDIHEKNDSDTTPRSLAFSGGHINISAWLDLHDQLIYDAGAGNTNQVAAALAAGCNVNVINNSTWRHTALHCAVTQGKKNVIKILLLIPGICVNGQDSIGFTALHRAIFWFPSLGVIRLLISAPNIDVNSRDFSGNTPLHLVAQFNKGQKSIEAARLLLRAGADQTITNNAGLTPLNVVERNGNHQLAALLKQAQEE
jgi:ankyrin repeat protein